MPCLSASPGLEKNWLHHDSNSRNPQKPDQNGIVKETSETWSQDISRNNKLNVKNVNQTLMKQKHVATTIKYDFHLIKCAKKLICLKLANTATAPIIE